MDRDSNQPTLSSLWQTAAGLPVTDELLAWPADLFALTDVILGRSEAYRLCLAPPEGQVWPPGRFPSWPAAVEQAAQQWILRLEDGRAALPDLVLEQWRVLRSRSVLPIELLAEGSDWPMCEALLTLHAVSDEACAGLGVVLDRSDGHGCVYRAQGRELLARTGSLARIPIHLVRVLPKVRTPTKGNSLRSFSRYVCVRGPSVAVHWHKVPARRTGQRTSLRARQYAALALDSASIAIGRRATSHPAGHGPGVRLSHRVLPCFLERMPRHGLEVRVVARVPEDT